MNPDTLYHKVPRAISPKNAGKKDEKHVSGIERFPEGPIHDRGIIGTKFTSPASGLLLFVKLSGS
jgi:hypothetical protein